MKRIMLLALLSFSFVLTSCSSLKDKFNDVKLDVAKEGKEFVTKELKSEYASSTQPAAVCESEAEKIGLKVEDGLIKFLKAEQKQAALQEKSLTANVLPAVCTFVVSQIVPEVIEGIKTEYVCLREVGGDKIVKIGEGLCAKIKI